MVEDLLLRVLVRRKLATIFKTPNPFAFFFFSYLISSLTLNLSFIKNEKKNLTILIFISNLNIP